MRLQFLLLVQEIVWQIVYDLDLETVRKKRASERIPFLEIATVAPKTSKYHSPDDGTAKPQHIEDPIAYADKMPSDKPRVIKSHMTFEHLPPKLLDTCKGKTG